MPQTSIAPSQSVSAQSVLAQSVSAQPAPFVLGDQAEPLLRLAGTPAKTLIVADHAARLMCALIRHGCSAATAIRPGEKPDAYDYDLIFLAHTSDFSDIAALTRFACRYLSARGRLVVCVSNPAEATALVRDLRRHGFSPRLSRSELGSVVHADWQGIAA